MTMNIYYSNKRANSNFDGDWNSICKYCNSPHEEHIWREHPDPNYLYRMPCEKQKEVMIKSNNRINRFITSFIFIGWILIPLIIAILGFAAPIIGAILLVISIFKICFTAIKFYGKPETWIPGYKEKVEKESKMEHYFHHCEENPEAFERLKLENLKRDGSADFSG